MLVVKRVIEEAGHFALVELENGSFAMQQGGVRVNNLTRKASRIGTDHDLTIYNNLETAKEKYDSHMEYLLGQFARWGTN